jgi:hypothetical protein
MPFIIYFILVDSDLRFVNLFFCFLLSDLFRKVEVFSNRKAIDLAIKETLRYGLFLGTFAGTFVSVDEIIAYLGGHRRYILHSPI